MWQFAKSMRPYLTPNKSYIWGALIFGLLLALIRLAQAYLVKPIFNTGLDPESAIEETIYLALVLSTLALINIPVRFCHFYWLRHMVTDSGCRLRLDIYQRLQNFKMETVANTKEGQLTAKIVTDVQLLMVGVQGLIELIREPFLALSLLGLAFYIDWQLTLVILATAPLLVLIFHRTGKRVKHYQNIVQDKIGNMTHHASEGLNGQKFIKVFNLQHYAHQRFQKQQEDCFQAQMKAIRVEELASPLVEFVGAITLCGILLFAHFRVQQGQISTGDFISFITTLVFIMDPVRKFSRINLKINQGQAAGERLEELLNCELEEDLGSSKMQEFSEQIEFRDVRFSYNEGTEVLKGISFVVKKGQKVAFVGPSGSGKSTIIDLLMRLYNIQKGEYLIDRVSSKNLDLFSLRGLFSPVSQDVFLLNDCVRENISLGREISDEDLELACNVSHAKEFIGQLPNGENTIIGDRGNQLSGGQKQRLTIARAFLKNSAIYLLDEATSSLDNRSEKIIQEALDEVSENKTVIAVAHRLSTIRDFDQIYVLQDGLIVESGNHQELMAANGVYKKLYDMPKYQT